MQVSEQVGETVLQHLQNANSASSTPSAGDLIFPEVIHVHERGWKSQVMGAVLSLVVGGSLIFASKYLFKSILAMQMGADTEDEKEAKRNRLIRASLRERLGSNNLDTLNMHEAQLLSSITLPEEISVGFSDIGGLDEIKMSIKETIILPLVHPEWFLNGQGKRRNLLKPPKGVLFFGPPGTGKTLMAKAIAKDAGATFMNVRLSSLQSKWWGESLKLVRAVFSLARKVALVERIVPN